MDFSSELKPTMAERSMQLAARKDGPMFRSRSNMLPKKMRLKKDVFQTIMKGGKTFHSPFFLFYFLPDNIPSYAFVAPKGAYKTAVLRNKYRRMGYNFLREQPIKKGTGIFVFKKQAILAKKPDIKEDLANLLKKTGLI